MIFASLLFFLLTHTFFDLIFEDLWRMAGSLVVFQEPKIRIRFLSIHLFLVPFFSVAFTLFGFDLLKTCLDSHGHKPSTCPDLKEITHLCFEVLQQQQLLKVAISCLTLSFFFLVGAALVWRGFRFFREALNPIFSPAKTSGWSKSELDEIIDFSIYPYLSVPLRRDSLSYGGPRVEGMLSPAIILPRDFETKFSPAEQVAAIYHELGHIKGYDHWILRIVQIYRYSCFILPGPRWLSSKLSAALEERADDWAIRHGKVDPLVLSRAILKSSGFTEMPLGLNFQGNQPEHLAHRILRLRGKSFSSKRFPFSALIRLSALVTFCSSSWFQAHCLIEALF